MLEKVRGQIAAIDAEIVELIARRTDLASQVLHAKRADGFTPIDDATERNIDAGSVKKIFEILIAMNLEIQHGLSGEGNLP